MSGMVWRDRNLRSNYDNSLSNDRLIEQRTLTPEESSGSEFVEEEKPWPPTQERLSRSRAQKFAPRVPRPHSHLFRQPGGRSRAGKHTRRWENSLFLSSLHEIPEEELEAAASVLPPHNSAFSKLHSSDKHMQIWCSFSSRSEEDQLQLTSRLGNTHTHHQQPEKHNDAAQEMQVPPTPTPEQSFRRIEPRIRAIMRHSKCLPTGMMSDVEEELRFLFGLDSDSIIIVLQANPFCRLLLHGISQYLNLQSTTHRYGEESVMMVECGCGSFTPPELPLTSQFHCKER